MQLIRNFNNLPISYLQSILKGSNPKEPSCISTTLDSNAEFEW